MRAAIRALAAWYWRRVIRAAENNTAYLRKQADANERDIQAMRVKLATLQSSAR